MVRRNGDVLDVEVSSLVVDYDGEPAVVSFARDRTERKRLEAQLIVADRMGTLGRLAAGVAHEINNPLTYAMLNVDGLAREAKALRGESPDLTKIEAMIAAARDGLASVAAIVRDLRSLSSPRYEERFPVDVAAVVESSINVAMHAIRGRARLSRELGAVPFLRTDPARVGQIVLNLLLNAAQCFTTADEAKNEIRVSLGTEGDRVVVVVADDGPGIAPENMERIFEPFFTTKAPGEGMGMGLAVCRTTAQSLQGELSVESTVGAGSRFALTLPITRAVTGKPPP